MSEKIINPKTPSERDLKILAFMNEGNRIDSAKALGLFKTTGLRDCIYRLRKAGFTIYFQDISYKTKDGEGKYYRQWFTRDVSVSPTGEKTDKEVTYRKGEKSATDFAKEITKLTGSATVVQTLF